MTTSTTATTTTPTDELRTRAQRALDALGVTLPAGAAATLQARTPITGEPLLPVPVSSVEDVHAAVATAKGAFAEWRTTPAPIRGALVKRLGTLLGEHKEDLAELVTIEAGKIRSEALGEVQEMIDICDFAVGLSRQLDGRTMPSERPGHRLMETWHPLGVVGVISAFNFPVAVWSWNTAVALVCGDTVVWKPSEVTPLTALGCAALLDRAARDCGAPEGLNSVVVGDASVGEALVDHPDVALVSATGSERMGAAVAPRVAARFGKVLLELGGNNAAVVAPSADLELAARGITFSAAGTAGQRCTSTSRLVVQREVAEELVRALSKRTAELRLGDPLDPATDVGPVIDAGAARRIAGMVEAAVAEGAEVVGGGRVVPVEGCEGGAFVEPTVLRGVRPEHRIAREEVFGPVLSVLEVGSLDEALDVVNASDYGLSAAVYTRDVSAALRAVDALDTGIVYVNAPTIGAEISLPFGGTKATGNGFREAGTRGLEQFSETKTVYVDYSGRLQRAQIDNRPPLGGRQDQES